jgi:NADPH:quinone reductase and related Zn-dependent oxidoreductases
MIEVKSREDGLNTMKAIVMNGHGGTDSLRLDENFPEKDLSPNEVRVNIEACAINYHDIFTLRGMPGIKIPTPMILGNDMSGTIAELGSEVTGWSVGDRVMIHPVYPGRGLMGEMHPGGLAERCIVDAQQLIALPDEVSFEQAAALPVAYGTAYRMMFTIGNVQAGEKVLILGASGGVGTCAVQLAKLRGCEVIVCASSAEKLEQLKALGADHGIDYTKDDFMKEVWRLFGKPDRRSTAGGVDVVVNYTGGDTWVPSLRCMRRGGRLLTCGATAGFDPTEDLRYIWTYELQVLGSNGWTRQDLHDLLKLCQEGQLSPVIGGVYSLDDGIAALEAMESRTLFGKLIVKPKLS